MKAVPRTLTMVTPAVLVLCLSTSAQSAPLLDFETSHDESSVALSDSTDVSLGDLDVSLSEGLRDTRFSLAKGESTTFDFFDITLPTLGVGKADVDATLAFLSPETISGSAQGSGLWGSLVIGSGGRLNWDNQPGLIELDDGSTFHLAFSDLKGIQLGQEATVSATVEARSIADYANAVPAPGTLALFGLGLAGLAMGQRRQ